MSIAKFYGRNERGAQLRVAFCFLLVAGVLTAAPVAHAQPLPDNGWIYEIKGGQSGLCMTVGVTGELRQYACTGANSQRFQLLSNNDGTYVLRAQPEAQLCLGVKDASTNDTALVVQGNCAGGAASAQRWRLEAFGVGYRLVSAASGKCLVVQDASSAPGKALFQYVCNGGPNEAFTFTKFQHSSTDRASSGEWGPVINLGLVPSSVAALPDRTLLYWSGSGAHSFHGGTDTHYGIFDLATGGKTEAIAKTGYEMFCPGLAMIADGRVLIVGGGGEPTLRDRVVSYNYATKSWKSEAFLTIPRWYASALTLADGRVFTVGGDGDGQPIHTNQEKLGELWSPEKAAGDRWSLLDGISEPNADAGGDYYLARAQYYRRTVVTPNGRILEVAPSPAMRWHDIAGQGISSLAGTRAGDTNAQGAMAALYAPNRMLLSGGAISFGNEDPTKPESLHPARAKAYVIDLDNGTASPTAAMRYPRFFGNAVTLPTGQVLVIGGAPQSTLFSNDGAIMAPELFDPANRGWSVMAPMARPRSYHSVAVLMPDGRVWAGGGGQCGDCAVNEANAQIYSPPYLFKGLRPSLSGMPASTVYGAEQEINAQVGDSGIQRFTLVRMSATTHSTNTDQRFLDLQYQLVADGRFRLKMPTSGNIAPPGYYMLFAVSAKGVPSVASIVQIK